MAEEEEEVLAEVEAVESVYGGDCVVIGRFPPHLQVHVKPRTADVSSQQFVEAVIGMTAGLQYPDEPPQIDLVESKGLDEQRQKHLIVSLQDRARQLSSCLMLVALCEEAVEMLSIMNHPDGDCPLCLHPLLPEDKEQKILPFMKLMSCFHCFHSECIIRWWNWLQKEKESPGKMDDPKVANAGPEESTGSCPVCRKIFQASDLNHVLGLVGSHSSKLCLEGEEGEKDAKLLDSESERMRRQKFEAILKAQEERNGLIEPRKDLVVLPGMFLPQAATTSASASTTETAEQEPPPVPVTKLSRPSKKGAVASDSNPNCNGTSTPRGSSGERPNPGTRKNKARNVRRPVRHWVKKDEEGTAG